MGEADKGDWFQPFVNLNAQLIEGIDGVVGSAGVAIVVYTILIKIVTYPLTQPTLRTNALLQLISPQVEQIKRKYSNDENMRNTMQKRLFDEVGVNPLSGILPLFVQLPIFVALFRAIGQLAAQDAHFKESFLFIPSLAGPVASGNPSLDWLLKSQSAQEFIPLVGWQNVGGYLLLPAIVVASQVFTQSRSSVPGDSSQAFITTFFPVIIGISCLVSPSGLGLYWLTNNLLTTGQISLIQGQVAEELPEYKRIKDSAAQEASMEEGVRYTRNSEFIQESDAVKKSIADLEGGDIGAAAKPLTRKRKRAARKRKDGKK